MKTQHTWYKMELNLNQFVSDDDNSVKSSCLWLGIDLGTTSVKVVLINSEGTLVSSQSRSTNAHLKSDLGDAGDEQCPRKIMETVIDLVHPLICQHADHIKGIGVTGQMHGMLLWKQVKGCGEGTEPLNFSLRRPTSCLYTWQDQRCSPEFLETLPTPTNIYQPLATGHGCATLFWLMKNRQAFLDQWQFSSCGTIMDYLVCCLCDLNHPVTSDQLAASLGYLDRSTLCWDSVLTEDRDFPVQLLPKILSVGTKVGSTHLSVPGWPSGVPVYVAMGDVQCAMYSLLEHEQDAVVNISTSIQLGFVTPTNQVLSVRSQAPPCMTYFPYFNGCDLGLCAGLNGGNAIQHFVTCIAQWVTDLGFTQDVDIPSLLEKLQQLAEGSRTSSQVTTLPPPPCLEIRPIFFGERHNTSMTGHITGIHCSNFHNIGRIFKATCEGIVEHLHAMVPSEYLHQRDITRLLVSGSVVSNNSIVRQKLWDLYSTNTLEVVETTDRQEAYGSAIGAAQFVRQ